MRKRVLSLVIFVFIAVFFLYACKTAPAAKSEGGTESAEDSGKSASASKKGQGEPEIVDYGTLGDVIAKAQTAREEISSGEVDGAEGLDAVPAADKSLASAKSVYDLGEKGSNDKQKAKALTEAQDAYNVYNGIINKYWFERAHEARFRAAAAQKEAQKVKADVACREDYALSTETYYQGEEAYNSEEYKSACAFFIEAESLYINTAAIAAEKRRLAALALEQAEKKIEESERLAADADVLLNGGAGGANNGSKTGSGNKSLNNTERTGEKL